MTEKRNKWVKGHVSAEGLEQRATYGINMDRLKDLEVFTAVVNQGSFTDAGRTLGLSKSAISKHISLLEARLGEQLLTRTTRRVNPTSIGLVYFDRAMRVLKELSEADELINSLRTEPRGVLRVSVAEDFGTHYLTPILGQFFAEYPGIKLELVFENHFVELASGNFDMAIRTDQLDDSAMPKQKIAETTNRMIASPAYLEKHGRPERIDDLKNHKLLHYSRDPRTAVWNVTAPTKEKRQVRAIGGLTINDGQSLLNAAISGLGIAYLSSLLYAKPMAEGLVQDAMPCLPMEIQGIYALHAQHQVVSPKVRVFTEFLVNQFADKNLMDW